MNPRHVRVRRWMARHPVIRFIVEEVIDRLMMGLVLLLASPILVLFALLIFAQQLTKYRGHWGLAARDVFDIFITEPLRRRRVRKAMERRPPPREELDCK